MPLNSLSLAERLRHSGIPCFSGECNDIRVIKNGIGILTVDCNDFSIPPSLPVSNQAELAITMNDQTTKTIFESLIGLGFITPELCNQALQHPRIDELANYPGPANALVWLVTRNFLPEDGFAKISLAEDASDEVRQRQAIVDEVVDLLQIVRRNLNVRALDALLAEELISMEQHAEAAEGVPNEQAFSSPGTALSWMVMAGIIPTEAWGETCARVSALPESEQPQALKEAIKILTQIDAENHKAAASAFWHGVFPGSPWLWITGFILVFAGFGWYNFSASSVPACTDSSTIKTVNSMLFMGHVAARSDIMNGGHKLPPGAPRLSDVREAGYAKASRERGCLATLELEGSRVDYAFTIRPPRAGKQQDQGEFVVVGADARLVKARFGQIDAEGRFADMATPVGRENVEKAFRAGVEEFNKSSNSWSRSRALERILERRGQGKSSLHNADPDREREIAEIEPLAACHEQAPDTRYVCRLLIERNDPLLKAIGKSGSTTFESEFTFERDNANSSWRVSEVFSREYAEAISRAWQGDVVPNGQ